MNYWDNIPKEWTIGILNLISALIILVAGWAIASVISSFVKGFLVRAGWCKKISRTMDEDAARIDLETWISKIFYYIILLFVLVAFLEVLGLTFISEPINRMLTELFAYAPRIFGGLIIAVIAWFVAGAAKKLVLVPLRASRMDENIGSQAGLEQRQLPVSRSIAEVVYWLVWLLFLPMILDTLGIKGLLSPMQLMISKIMGFLPNLLATAVLLIIGWIAASIIRKITTNLLVALGSERLSERVGLSKGLGNQGFAGLIGQILFILVLIPVLIAALQALAIEAVTQPVSNMLNQLLNALPAIFGATIILIISYIIGKIIGDIVANLLVPLGFNSIMKHLRLGKEPIEGERSPSEIVGYLAFVAIMLFALIESCQILNFTLLADLIAHFVIFAGRVVLSLVIFAIGIFAANLAHTVILSNGMLKARILASSARIVILMFASAIALLEMGVANEIINLAFGLLLGAISVAIALAFGLGGREAAAREIEKWMLSLKSERP